MWSIFHQILKIVAGIGLATGWFFSCTSIEFIPDSDYTAYYSRYSLQSWEEVEIRKERPTRPFQIVGEVVLKDFEESEISEESIKKEMFRKKIDGIWFTGKKSLTWDGMNFETLDSRGNVSNSYATKHVVPIQKGFAFRYQKTP